MPNLDQVCKGSMQVCSIYQLKQIEEETVHSNQFILFFSQASFFTEIREVVRQEDLIRFDRLIFGRKGNLFDLLLAETGSLPNGIPLQQASPALQRRSMRIKTTMDKQQIPLQPRQHQHHQPINNTSTVSRVTSQSHEQVSLAELSRVQW